MRPSKLVVGKSLAACSLVADTTSSPPGITKSLTRAGFPRARRFHRAKVRVESGGLFSSLSKERQGDLRMNPDRDDPQGDNALPEIDSPSQVSEPSIQAMAEQSALDSSSTEELAAAQIEQPVVDAFAGSQLDSPSASDTFSAPGGWEGASDSSLGETSVSNLPPDNLAIADGEMVAESDASQASLRPRANRIVKPLIAGTNPASPHAAFIVPVRTVHPNWCKGTTRVHNHLPLLVPSRRSTFLLTTHDSGTRPTAARHSPGRSCWFRSAPTSCMPSSQRR